MFGNFTEYSVKLPNIRWNYRIFGHELTVAEYSVLDAEGSFSAETQKSGIGDSLPKAQLLILCQQKVVHDLIDHPVQISV